MQTDRSLMYWPFMESYDVRFDAVTRVPFAKGWTVVCCDSALRVKHE